MLVLDEKVPAVLLDLLVELSLKLGVGRQVVIGLGIHEVNGGLGSSLELGVGLEDDLSQLRFSGLQLSTLY